MSVEENKALVRREQGELWNHTGNLDAAAELFAPDRAEVYRIEGGQIAESWGVSDLLGMLQQLGAGPGGPEVTDSIGPVPNPEAYTSTCCGSA